MFIHDYIRNHLLETLGMHKRKMPDLDELKKTQWSPLFEKLMRNRLIMGSFRYGFIKDPNKPKFNRIGSIEKRIKLYKQTGNAEHLVDVSNIAMMEFEEQNHPNFHWNALDDGTHDVIQ